MFSAGKTQTFIYISRANAQYVLQALVASIRYATPLRFGYELRKIRTASVNQPPLIQNCATPVLKFIYDIRTYLVYIKKQRSGLGSFAHVATVAKG